MTGQSFGHSFGEWRKSERTTLGWIFLTALCLCLSTATLSGQPELKNSPQEGGAQSSSPPQTEPPLTITLEDAFKRAKANSPQFQSAITEYQMAREDHRQAKAALLPSAASVNQYLYTQGNGTPTGRYVANNAVHEYLSQVNIHQAVGLSLIGDYRRSQAAEALAQAKSEIALRGLHATVVQDYYALVVSQRKYATVQQAAEESERFLKIARALETGGEVAHSDVIKAQLQFNDRERDLKEAQLAMERARLVLAVLLFPDFNQNFTVVDDLRLSPPLPSLAEIQQLARQNNPDLRSALAAVEVATHEATVAKAGYLPTLSLDYFYGIDATHFATRTDGIPNLGYSAIATLNIPVWNWGSTRSKVRQADLRRKLAQTELTYAQRQLLSELNAFYGEAEAAHAEIDSLRNSAALASESLRLTTLRYQAGEVSVLEVVDAQNTLTQSRHAYDDGEMRFRVALANLQTLTGTF